MPPNIPPQEVYHHPWGMFLNILPGEFGKCDSSGSYVSISSLLQDIVGKYILYSALHWDNSSSGKFSVDDEILREMHWVKLAGLGSWMTTESATGGGILDSCEQQAVQKQRNHQGMK